MAVALTSLAVAGKSPVRRLAHGKTARFGFRPTKTGVCRFACLVPGHEAAGMHDVLVLEVVTGGILSIRDLCEK